MTAPRRKPMRLTALKVREISSVDRGAAEGAKVVLMKRDDTGEDVLDDLSADEPLAMSFEEALDEIEQVNETTEKRGSTMPYPITNPIEFSKRVLAGEPTSCTRADLFKAMQALAEDYRRPDETAEQALATYLMKTEDGRALYAAYRVLPNPAPEQQVAKVVAPAPSPSLERLNKLADDLRNREPSLSAEMAFTKVYSDPRNRELVRKERDENRPGLTVVEKGGGSAPFADRVASLASSLARTHRDLSHADCIKAVLERNPVLAAAFRREQAQAA